MRNEISEGLEWAHAIKAETWIIMVEMTKKSPDSFLEIAGQLEELADEIRKQVANRRADFDALLMN